MVKQRQALYLYALNISMTNALITVITANYIDEEPRHSASVSSNSLSYRTISSGCLCLFSSLDRTWAIDIQNNRRLLYKNDKRQNNEGYHRHYQYAKESL